MAEETRVCCFGSNRGWLLFFVSLSMLENFGDIVWAVVQIKGIDDQWDEMGAEEQSAYKSVLALNWLRVVVRVMGILLSCMPIFAETRKKPILHLAYRNWKIIALMFAVTELISSIAGFGIPPDGAVTVLSCVDEIVWVCMTILTLVLVNRRMKELQGDIGQFSFVRFTV